jgi:hypothetical protein
MTFESELLALLQAQSSLTDLVADRVFPVHELGGTPPGRPYVAYLVVFAEPRNTLDGPGDISKVRLQVDCYADDFDTAAALGRALQAAIPSAGGTLHGLCINAGQDFFESDVRLYRRMLEFSLFHRT